MKNKSNKQLWLSVFSLLTGSIASEVFTFALGMYILKIYKSSFLFSMIILTGPVVSLLLSPLIGYVVDNFSHKKIAMISQSVSIIVMAIATLLIFNWFNKYIFILLVIILSGILEACDAFQSTAYKASTTGIVVKEDQQKIIALEQGVNIVVTLLSPILGGVLYAILPIKYFFSFDLIGEILTLLLIIPLNFQLFSTLKTAVTQKRKHILENFKEGISFIIKDKILVSLTVFSVVINLCLASINVGVPYILLTKLSMNTREYGVIQALLALGMLGASLIWSTVKLKSSLLKTTGLFGLLVTLSLILFCSPIASRSYVGITYGIAMTILGFAIVSINMPSSIYVRTQVEEDYQGRINIFFNSTLGILTPIGTAVFGILFEKVSGTILFFVSALIILLMSILLITENNVTSNEVHTKF